MSSSSSSYSLRIVWSRWRDIFQQHHLKLSDIYSHLKSRCSNQTVAVSISFFELFFNFIPFFFVDLSRVLFWFYRYIIELGILIHIIILFIDYGFCQNSFTVVCWAFIVWGRVVSCFFASITDIKIVSFDKSDKIFVNLINLLFIKQSSNFTSITFLDKLNIHKNMFINTIIPKCFYKIICNFFIFNAIFNNLLYCTSPI